MLLDRRAVVVAAAVAALLFPAVAVVSPLPVSAQGGPPVITDDPWTPRPSHWEINTGWEMERAPGHTMHALPEVDLNYGWGKKVQLKVEAPFVIAHESGVAGSASSTETGLGNPLAGVKFRFAHNFYGLAMSAYPQVQIPVGDGAAARLDASTHWALLMPLEIAASFGSLDLGVEGGYWFGVKEERETMGGLVAGFEITSGFEVVAECNAEGIRFFHPDELVCGGGFRRDITEHVAVMGAYEPVIAGGEVGRPTSRMYVGIQTHVRGGGLWKGRKRQPPDTEIHNGGSR